MLQAIFMIFYYRRFPQQGAVENLKQFSYTLPSFILVNFFFSGYSRVGSSVGGSGVGWVWGRGG